MAKQFRIGNFWLAWRTDRQEWSICWNDSTAGTRRRKSTGIRDYNAGEAPSEAQQALADHFAQHGQPEAIDPNTKASLSRVLTTWLAKEGIKRARAQQYGYAVEHLQRWINTRGQMMVADVSPTSTMGYIEMRWGEGVSGETIRSELSALGTALSWSADNSLIPYAPRVAKVPKEMRSGPREIEYDMEQMARLLEVAREKQPHVHLFIMTMMSTHGRVEAVLELFAEQIRKGLIYFNAPGRTQTTKKRAIVPVVPSLAPWLPKSGKVITYRAIRKDGTILERPTYSIKKAFAHCLVDAGIVDRDGKPWGYPNALRHTIHTYLQTVGVPQAQIDAAAGHNSEKGSGRNYTHLRPEYLNEFVAAVEGYWSEMDKHTTAHRRSQVGPKRVE